jgi:hypothetical protein
MSRDPLGEAGGLNLYAAMGNSAVNYIDPFGLIDQSQVGDVDPNQLYNEAYNEWNQNRQGVYKNWGRAGLVYDMLTNLDKTKFEAPFPYIWLGDPDSYANTTACQNYAQNAADYLNSQIPPGIFGNNKAWAQNVDNGHTELWVQNGDLIRKYDPWKDFPPLW